MGKKRNAKKFRALAAVIMPAVMLENTVEKHIYTEKQLLDEVGYVPKEGEKLNPIANVYNAPVQIQMNHARRLRKAFRSGGYEGMNQYAQKVADALNRSKNEQQQD